MGEEAADLAGGEAEGAVDELRGGAADVGSDEAVGCGPERMAGGERLGVGDVDGGLDVMLLKGGDEGVGVNNGAAGGVDEQGAALHEGELGGADEAAGGVGERDDQDDDVGLREQGVEVRDGADRGLGAGAAGDAEDVDAERGEAGFDGGADGAVADDEDGLAGEVFAEDGVLAAGGAGLGEEAVGDGGEAAPLLPVLEVAVEGDALHGGQDGAEDPLGCGDVVNAATVAEGDIGGKPWEDPVDAGHEGLGNLDAAELLEGGGDFLSVEGEYPEIDGDGLGDNAGEADDFGLGGEVREEFGCEVFVYADTDHSGTSTDHRRAVLQKRGGLGNIGGSVTQWLFAQDKRLRGFK